MLYTSFAFTFEFRARIQKFYIDLLSARNISGLLLILQSASHDTFKLALPITYIHRQASIELLSLTSSYRNSPGSWRPPKRQASDSHDGSYDQLSAVFPHGGYCLLNEFLEIKNRVHRMPGALRAYAHFF
jgi:hypothetical protein